MDEKKFKLQCIKLSNKILELLDSENCSAMVAVSTLTGLILTMLNEIEDSDLKNKLLFKISLDFLALTEKK